MKIGCSLFVLLFFIIFLFSINFVLVSAVRINEVMYDPNDTYQCKDAYCEYIEIYNNENITINLTGWKLCNDTLLSGYIDNRSGQNLLINNLTLEPFQYALITDGKSGTLVYYNFNVSDNSLAFHVDGATMCGGLNENGENISILNSSGGIIDNIHYNKTLGWQEATGGKSLQKINISAENTKENWRACEPTPGRENNCSTTCIQNWSCSAWGSCINGNQTRSCPDLNTCSNLTGKPAESQPCNTTTTTNQNQTKKISIHLDYEDDNYNSDEFEVTLNAENLEDYDYDGKIWIEYEGKIISQIYDEESGKWKSGNYYVSAFSGPGEADEKFLIKLSKDNENFTGEADIIARMRKSGASSYIEDKDSIEINARKTKSASSQNSVNESGIIATESGISIVKENDIINLEKDIKTYKSKNELIKEYSLLGFTLVCLLALVILLVRLKSKSQYAK